MLRARLCFDSLTNCYLFIFKSSVRLFWYKFQLSTGSWDWGEMLASFLTGGWALGFLLSSLCLRPAFQSNLGHVEAKQHIK